MGLLNLISKPKDPVPMRLPSGSFTVNRHGRIVASTLPQGFPLGRVMEIAEMVATTFREARDARLPLQELSVHYPAFRLTARELRGGAMVFFFPKSLREMSLPNA
jgi:hypothetical protein